MRRRILLGLAALAPAGMIVNAAGCDPRQQALEIFRRQGLNLLQPAREYIRPGGLVVVVKGRAEYDDPRDGVGEETGNLTNFRGVILQEAERKSTGFGAALALANSVLPIGLQLSGSSTVSLGQIQTTGVRLPTAELDRLIQRPETSAAATAELRQKHRVFIVQEVYKATELDLQAADQKVLDVRYNDKTAVAQCKAPGAEADKPASPEAKKEGPKKEEPKDSTGQSAASPSAAPSATPPAADKAAADKAAAAKADAKAADAGPGGGVAVCRSGDFTLKFTVSDPIPFAVRLAELELAGGSLRRKREGISLTLGADKVGAAIVGPKAALTNLERRPGSR